MWKILVLFSLNSYAAVDCSKEIEKLCKDSKQEFSKCLKESVQKLPTECKNKTKAISPEMVEIGTSCLSEVLEICPVSIEEMSGDMKKESAKKLACLKKNEAKISKKCKTFVSDLLKEI